MTNVQSNSQALGQTQEPCATDSHPVQAQAYSHRPPRGALVTIVEEVEGVPEDQRWFIYFGWFQLEGYNDFEHFSTLDNARMFCALAGYRYKVELDLHLYLSTSEIKLYHPELADRCGL